MDTYLRYKGYTDGNFTKMFTISLTPQEMGVVLRIYKLFFMIDITNIAA